MELKVALSFVCSLVLASFSCYGAGNEKSRYTPIQYLKNYGLSSCIANGYKSKDVVNDASAGANGYKELGSLGIDAYNEVAVMGRKFLEKEYLSQSGEKLIIMKCIDFFHSKELDRLAHKYASKR
jgi:hypothetical protein